MRSGALLASLFSTMPIWRDFDPISIVSSSKGNTDKNTLLQDNSDMDKEARTHENKIEELFDHTDKVERV